MVAMTELARFTKADLELAAGARSYERGLDYLRAVTNLEVTDTSITATVYGGSEYRVRLSAGDGGLGGTCTCP
jgi:uncharacterized Zn finger protein